ncbi:MAG: phenylalanine--tRNA ligase subunit beta [Candidatus Buchananbacteria bacterium RBG_13_36_9]|uniref:Phenylalanine--tRNA ligase beta subunit n=1 Tax=Candidatus Buchananbacteria bacterium RBG_13_36_9 TaxID=1797530 RepID=A0A1G1XNT1_9BACT|nr:MAG: phenylalanine--tRNA ligase subunit beta [Candidatus Buchananbacteria bacterium RBG_13_36_9]
MLISRNWLKDFVKIPDSLSAKELGLKLTMAMAEVEGFSDQKESLKGVVVGEILAIKKHPNADKLKLAVVNIGLKKLNVVCGGPNIEKGQKVPVATLGTLLPNGMKIEKVKVRGEESEGMLCAEDELGLGKDHSGIIILDKKSKVGESLAKVLGLDDVIYEIDNKSLTHRPDLWSQYGVAREVGAILGEKLKEYKVMVREPHHDTKLDIKVEDYKLCPRYMGVVLEGIEIAESPEWLKKRVSAIGMRPINNIVDITNYVMMEIGQPLHAFDYDKLEGHRIIVRTAKAGEKIKTLDDQERKLDDSMLVIADAKKPVAIAGVMGGANTEIDNKTKKIIIESANFDHVSIRKTEAKLGLRSEASIRFEKSLDPNISELGIKRAMELILQVCPKAKIVSKIEDVKKFNLNQGPIKVSFDFLNKKIGEEIEPKKVVSILESLGFEVRKQKDGLSVLVPTWRATKDVSIPEDMVEEVARIFGYDNLKIDMPLVAMERPEVNKERELERKIKNILAYGLAMSEVYNYSFNSEEQLKKTGLHVESHIKIANPLSSETTRLRISLLPNLLNNIIANERFFNEIKLFEVGSVYLKDEPGERLSDKKQEFLPYQEKHFAGVLVQKEDRVPFYSAKNVVESLFKKLHFSYQIKAAKTAPVWGSAGKTATIFLNGKQIGLITELNYNLYNKLGIDNKVGIFEFSLTELNKVYTDEMSYLAIPKFPSIDLDISMVIDKNILWGEIKEAVIDIEKDLIRKVTIFDVYQGKGIPEDKKSIAFRIEYRSDDKTLTMAEVQIIQQEVLKTLEEKFKAQIRK